MATSAAQGAAGTVADGSAAAFATTGAPVIPVDGTTVGVAVTTAVVAAAVAVGVVVAGSESGICPNITEYDIYPGRLDIYFATPLEPLTLEVGGQLEDLVIDRYNEFYGCERPFSRLMLNSTLRCRDSENECCQLVDTDSGPRLLCEIDTISHCVGCWESEPLFWDNSTSVVDSNATESRYLQEQPRVTTWEESFGCFELVDASFNITPQVLLCLDWVVVRQIEDGTVVVSTEKIPPTTSPTDEPTRPPTSRPTNLPTNLPTRPPTNQPTSPPTSRPTNLPTGAPTDRPTRLPTSPPTDQPTHPPTRLPTNLPTSRPTHPPTGLPTSRPTSRPTHPPTRPPTNQPTKSPTNRPTKRPTRSPTRPPTNKPTYPPTKRLP
jgi:hypothetical protein